jgi:hypothetical protein
MEFFIFFWGLISGVVIAWVCFDIYQENKQGK